MLEGICRSLIGWGFTDLLFLNTHAGNVSTLTSWRRRSSKMPERAACRSTGGGSASTWRFKELTDNPWVAGHAGELCTSVLMYLRSDLVRSGPYQDFVPQVDPFTGGIRRIPSYREVTSSGVLGRPTLADAGSVGLAVDEIVREARVHFNTSREGVSSAMRVAAVQIKAGASKEANVERALELIDEAVAPGAGLSCFPSTLRSSPPKRSTQASPNDCRERRQPALRRRRASTASMSMRENFIEVSPVPGKFYNTSYVLDPEGEIRAVYRKVHLFDIDVPGEVTL